MKSLCILFALAGMLACTPIQVKSAPTPSPQDIALSRQVQSRVLPVAASTVFPKVITVLLDNGYIVRSANEKVGLVCFYQQWVDASQFHATLATEGTLLFEPEGADSTRARLLITGNWQAMGGGPKASAEIMGAQQNASPEEYKKLFQILEKGLAGPK